MSKIISNNPTFALLLKGSLSESNFEHHGQISQSSFLVPNANQSSLGDYFCLTSSRGLNAVKGKSANELIGVDVNVSEKSINSVSFSVVNSDDLVCDYIELDPNGSKINEANLSSLVSDSGTTQESSFDIESIEEPGDLKEVAISLLSNANLGSKKWLLDQISESGATGDIELNGVAHEVVVSNNLNQVIADGKGTATLALADCLRGLAVSGSKPKGVSVAAQLDGENVEMVALSVIGEKSSISMDRSFKNKGDLIFILGQTEDSIESSEYLVSYHRVDTDAIPQVDVKKELSLINVLNDVIQEELINAAHNCSRGGVFISLAEMGMKNELGFDIVTDSEVREDAFLFGETPSRAIVTVNEDQEDEFIEFMMKSGVSFTLLGHVTKGKMVIDDLHYGFITEAKDLYDHSIENSFSVN